MRENRGFPGLWGLGCKLSLIEGLRGWRRSGDRTRLQPNSLQTGNFSGKFRNCGVWETISESEAPVPQRLFAHFPTRTNRENNSSNREFFRTYQGIGKRPLDSA
jgi:hypothetical protein